MTTPDIGRGALARCLRVVDAETPVRVEVPRSSAGLQSALGESNGEVLIAGGDGTVQHVLRRLDAVGALPEVTVGVIPLGTGNDFAAAAGVPLDPTEAARAWLTAPARGCDLLNVDPVGLVTNACHVGFGAHAAVFARRLKPGLGRAAYPTAAALTAVRARTMWVSLTHDGHTIESDDVVVAAVCNGHRVGGGTVVYPDARLDDGVAGLVTAHAGGRRGWVALGRALRRRETAENAAVRTASISCAEIRLDRPELVDADGELSGPASLLRARVQPEAVALRAPESGNAYS